MIVYGTEIKSALEFPLHFSGEREKNYTLNLVEMPPSWCMDGIVCGIPFSPRAGIHGRSIYLYSDRVLDEVVKGQPFCYEAKGVASFSWVNGEDTVYCTLEEGTEMSLLSFWFVHLFLPLYYTLGDMYEMLHGGAVEIGGMPVLFLAPSMGGKSTLTQFFIDQGHAFVSDDKVPAYLKDDIVLVGNSHPYYRPYRKFEDLGLYAEKCVGRFMPLNLAFYLEPVDADAEIAIAEIVGQEKFSSILQSCLYHFPFFKHRRMKNITKLQKSMKLFRITVPRDFCRRQEVYDKICQHTAMVEFN